MIVAALAVAAAMLNPHVSQANIRKTVCVRGFATVYRAAHPIPVHTRPGMVVDHNVSIELGGASSVANMRYQTIANGHLKDRLENTLHAEVCAGKITLQAAQVAVIAFVDK